MRKSPSRLLADDLLIEEFKGNDLQNGTVGGEVRRGRRRRMIAFGWYGGKFSHLEWLLPLLPECHHYCEPFAGSGAVPLNRQPAPVETYNDIDGEAVNFFRVLRLWGKSQS